ncbi:hypothetical protein D1007_28030 [Hordeum vulgare]|nr:hypothetical protein D1007_28030 [Hordeum vulgare]
MEETNSPTATIDAGGGAGGDPGSGAGGDAPADRLALARGEGGDSVGGEVSDYGIIFWAIEKAESSDPIQAERWRRFKSTSPSWLNIRPPSITELANTPLEYLPQGVSPPRLP